jgi:hypothetical protein
MLAKDPAQRYPTPERAIQDLRVFLAAEEAPEQPQPKMQEYLKWLAAKQPADAAPVPPPKTDDSPPRDTNGMNYKPGAQATGLGETSGLGSGLVGNLHRYGIPLGIIAGGLLVLTLLVFLALRLWL